MCDVSGVVVWSTYGRRVRKLMALNCGRFKGVCGGVGCESGCGRSGLSVVYGRAVVDYGRVFMAW